MKKLDPYKKIKTEALDAVSRHIDSSAQHSVGDSPIEKLFSHAFRMSAIYSHSYERGSLRFMPEGKDATGVLAKELMYDYVVFPQYKIGKYRVDFLICAFEFGGCDWENDEPVYDQRCWKFLVVECDGHDFHERTKEQAARDRKRDREMSLDGYEVFRFTGSEIWRNPTGCALDVINWGKFR